MNNIIDYKKQKPYQRKTDINTITAGLEKFKEQHGRYPTSTEITDYRYLPSVKFIERKFGGIKSLRKQLDIKVIDFRTGKERRKTAIMCNQRAEEYSKKMRKYLEGLFTPMRVHVEHALTDKTNNRCDYLVYLNNNQQAAVDLFYPATKNSLSGCLNTKIKKYDKIKDFVFYNHTIFVCMNDKFTQEEIDKIVNNKKQPIDPKYTVMSLKTFKEFCQNNKHVV